MNLFKFVAYFKTYFNSLSSYLGIVNFVLLLLTFKNVYGINIKAYIIVLFALLVGLIVGFIDYKYIIREQNIISNNKNDLKSDLKKVMKELKIIKDKLK